ncbi:MAG: ATP-binding protein [Sphingomonadaceae bacterium]
MPNRGMGRPVGSRTSDYPLLRWLAGTAVGLAVLHVALILLWGRGQVIAALPWYSPMMNGLVALAGISIAFLSFGRYRVLRDLAPFWIGVAFTGFAVFAVFYVLSLPGLLPGGGSLIGHHLNTASWFWHLQFSVQAIFLLVSTLVSWPRASAAGERWWLWLVVAGVTVGAAVGWLLVDLEPSLPVLVADGAWTPLNTSWDFALLLAFAAGAVLSARRYRRTGDLLFGYVAFTQLFLAFTMLTVIVGQRFYDQWWYWQRILWLAGFSMMLFGLLAEYVGLYRSELERSRELELLRQEAEGERGRLQTLIDTAPVGIAFYLAPDGRVELLNKAAEAILGRVPTPRMTLVEQAVLYRISRPSGEPVPVQEMPIARALRGESCVGAELVIRQPSGRELYLLVNSSPIRGAEGRIVGAVATYEDITRVKEQERLRDEFLATASHELKTPVTSIKGYVQLMQHWAPGGHEPREGKAFQVINTQADRIARRVQEMLEVARLRIAPPPLHRVRFDLVDLVTQMVAQMQSTTEIHRLVFRRKAAIPVEADQERIEDVLVALLDNAIKYSPDGGEIEVQVQSQGGEAVVSVRDHGVGIPRERQAYVFEPFYEPIPPGAPGYQSVAPLSLYLSRLTIERYGGRIWFESEEGKGSTFRFSLPLASEGGDAESG